MTSIKDRILQIADLKEDSKAKFFENIGASYSNFRGKSKKSSPSADILVDISSFYPDVNTDWLLTGIGEMTNNSSDLVEEPASDYINNKIKGIPYYDVDFTASFLEVVNDQQLKPDHYVTHPFFMGCDLIVRASGQSMAKVIKHGDAIGLIQIDTWMDFIPMGEIYAIVTHNGFRMIKIITKGPDENHFTLISKPTDGKKEEFPDQDLPKKHIMSIFKVQASSHLF